MPRGITMVEALLTIGLLAVLFALSVPVASSFYHQQGLGFAGKGLVSSLRLASARARAGANDSPWGVSITSGTITLFSGASFAARDATYDDVTSFPTSITISGTGEYVFSPLTGYPGSTGTTTFTSASGASFPVSVNAYGTVTY